MAKIEKSRARKPLVEGVPLASYSDQNNHHLYGFTIRNEDEDKTYFVRLTSEEMQHIVAQWLKYQQEYEKR